MRWIKMIFQSDGTKASADLGSWAPTTSLPPSVYELVSMLSTVPQLVLFTVVSMPRCFVCAFCVSKRWGYVQRRSIFAPVFFPCIIIITNTRKTSLRFLETQITRNLSLSLRAPDHSKANWSPWRDCQQKVYSYDWLNSQYLTTVYEILTANLYSFQLEITKCQLVNKVLNIVELNLSNQLEKYIYWVNKCHDLAVCPSSVSTTSEARTEQMSSIRISSHHPEVEIGYSKYLISLPDQAMRETFCRQVSVTVSLSVADQCQQESSANEPVRHTMDETRVTVSCSCWCGQNYPTMGLSVRR